MVMVMEAPSADGKAAAIREPLLEAEAEAETAKGGFRTLPFIIANEGLERLATSGLTPNMILYLTQQYNMGNTAAANVINLWSAATNFTPILGALIADSYAGKYRMVGFGSILSFLGMVLFWLTTMFPQATPNCDRFSGICESPTTLQLLFLYSSFGIMSIGAGGIRSSSAAFGVDQLDKIRNTPEYAKTLRSLFNWYYVSISVGIIIASTVIVYIQDNLGWKMGFGVCVVLMLVALLSFYLATPFYIKLKAKTSLLTGFAQALVASFRNRHINLPSQATNEVCFLSGSMFEAPSENLRFLNKACVIKNPQQDLTLDGNASNSNPWSLCTVDQVEELKALIRVMPICSTGIMVNVVTSQGSFIVIQTYTMDRHITSNFEIPAASFSLLLIIALIVGIFFYEHIALPLASKVKGKSVRLSLKQRMGIGLLFSCAAMVSAAIAEYIRRGIAIKEGLSDEPQALVHMSALWVMPFYLFCGLSEAFNAIPQYEFFFSELPKTMASIASSLVLLGLFAGSLVASFIMDAVEDISKRGGESWLSSNINKGHYDYYYWFIAGLSVLNFVYYLACCKAYGPCKADDNESDHQADQASRI
ncbi:Proton-dependent oligopeptide transporter family [Corchorus olitorius]|uniref:Proton-dependent oligopeptide transporter family n=1 Tax=Corchorus olitorius TaxID=93759 RepID=A0A1R3J898_9ROSI|nr:Proton-dependent oligopeptide transporter family [Corchorus olitorius]